MSTTKLPEPDVLTDEARTAKEREQEAIKVLQDQLAGAQVRLDQEQDRRVWDAAYGAACVTLRISKHFELDEFNFPAARTLADQAVEALRASRVKR